MARRGRQRLPGDHRRRGRTRTPARERARARRRDGRQRHRRGQPSLHRRFAARHADSGWHGSAESFGVGAAILMGDLLLSWTDEMFHASGLPAEATERGHRVLSVMRTEVMAGQYLDLLEQVSGAGTVRVRVARRELQVRQVHRRAAAASRRRTRRRTGWRGAAPTRGTACRSAPRSSFATTCSACSATLRRPASRRATTCARASGPCSSLSRSPRPAGRQRRRSRGGSGIPGSIRPGVAEAQEIIRGAGALLRVRGNDRALPVRGDGSADRRSGRSSQGSTRRTRARRHIRTDRVADAPAPPWPTRGASDDGPLA